MASFYGRGSTVSRLQINNEEKFEFYFESEGFIMACLQISQE